jgi:hypothetical protein
MSDDRSTTLTPPEPPAAQTSSPREPSEQRSKPLSKEQLLRTPTEGQNVTKSLFPAHPDSKKK